MSAIDQVKAHFSRLAVRLIEVPEWTDDAGKPLVIYVAPITLHERMRLQAIGEQEGRAAGAAHLLILKAMDASGAKLFTLEDKYALMHQAESGVMMRVALEVNTAPSVEDAEKN